MRGLIEQHGAAVDTRAAAFRKEKDTFHRAVAKMAVELERKRLPKTDDILKKVEDLARRGLHDLRIFERDSHPMYSLDEVVATARHRVWWEWAETNLVPLGFDIKGQPCCSNNRQINVTW